MKRNDFRIGQEFWCGGKRWRCTDIGTRVVIAICLEPHEVVRWEAGERLEDVRTSRRMTDDASWHNGPPYALEECVFDEYDMAVCSLQPDAVAS